MKTTPVTTKKLIHKGKPACIIGSGDSLLDHIHKIPPESIIFCVNTRPLRKKILTPEQVTYLVYGDHNEVERSVPYFGKVIRCSFPTYLSAGMHPTQTDIALDNNIFAGGFSSTMAVSLAHYMGCYPIILFGMDCYRGKPYFDSEPCPDCEGSGKYKPNEPINYNCETCKGTGTKEHHTCQDQSLKDHLNAWLRLSNHLNRRFIDSKEFPLPTIFTVSPPLDLIFLKWNLVYFLSLEAKARIYQF
jgi:hypothetical protein